MLALWRGELPLPRAFWQYAVFYGLIATMAATTAALSVIAADRPIGLALALHFLPTPYYVVSVVGVWRSADAYAGPPFWAQAARIAVAVWTVVVLVV